MFLRFTQCHAYKLIKQKQISFKNKQKISPKVGKWICVWKVISTHKLKYKDHYVLEG